MKRKQIAKNNQSNLLETKGAAVWPPLLSSAKIKRPGIDRAFNLGGTGSNRNENTSILTR